jgi:hypothetical protein
VLTLCSVGFCLTDSRRYGYNGTHRGQPHGFSLDIADQIGIPDPSLQEHPSLVRMTVLQEWSGGVDDDDSGAYPAG